MYLKLPSACEHFLFFFLFFIFSPVPVNCVNELLLHCSIVVFTLFPFQTRRGFRDIRVSVSVKGFGDKARIYKYFVSFHRNAAGFLLILFESMFTD